MSSVKSDNRKLSRRDEENFKSTINCVYLEVHLDKMNFNFIPMQFKPIV